MDKIQNPPELQHKGSKKSDNISLADNPNALDFFYSNIVTTCNQKEMKMNQTILFPNVSFDYYEIAQLQLVQTPLVDNMMHLNHQ